MKRKTNKFSLGVSFVACVMLFVLALINNNNPAVIQTGSGSATNSGKKIIVLDAGHGGLDSGCVGVNGALEKDINLAIVKNLEALLTFSGYEVVLTRNEDRSMHDDGVEGIRNQKISDMNNRLKVVQSYPDSLFISIHQNQFTQPQYFGAQMFYNTNHRTNFKLATIMQRLFSELQPENNREVQLMNENLFLFKDAKQPSILIECGFLSNENDAKNLSDETYQKMVAFTIYKGLCEYFEATASDVTGEGLSNEQQNQESLYMQ
jgi:N-acetylmuramoyl-L-alanine amidase